MSKHEGKGSSRALDIIEQFAGGPLKPAVDGILQFVGKAQEDAQTRKLRLLEIDAMEREAHLTMEHLRHEAQVDWQTREHNVELLRRFLEVTNEWVRTQVQLQELARRAQDQRMMEVSDWVIARQKELNQRYSENMQQLLATLQAASASGLGPSDQNRYTDFAYQVAKNVMDSISETSAFLNTQAQRVANEHAIDIRDLQDEYRRMTNMRLVEILSIAAKGNGAPQLPDSL